MGTLRMAGTMAYLGITNREWRAVKSSCHGLERDEEGLQPLNFACVIDSPAIGETFFVTAALERS